MRSAFVKTANVERFLSGISAVNQQRNAPEACWMLCPGEPGHGKSRAMAWYQAQANAIFVRLQPGMTCGAMRRALLREAAPNLTPAYKSDELTAQLLGALVGQPRPIILDEIEHGLADGAAVLDTVRGVTDLCETPVILSGRASTVDKLRRHRAIWTRLSAIAPFERASLSDAARLCAELAEVPVADEVIAEIHRQSEGSIREIVKAIGNCERIGRRLSKGEAVTMAMVGGAPLTHEWINRRAAR